MKRSQWLLCHLYSELRVETPDGVKKVSYIKNGYVYYQIPDNTPHRFTINDDLSNSELRPILRDLSTMTEAEKREFRLYSGLAFPVAGLLCLATLGFVSVYYGNDAEFCRDVSAKELYWLLERGFYVGQCPREEAVIER